MWLIDLSELRIVSLRIDGQNIRQVGSVEGVNGRRVQLVADEGVPRVQENNRCRVPITQSNQILYDYDYLVQISADYGLPARSIPKQKLVTSVPRRSLSCLNSSSACT